MSVRQGLETCIIVVFVAKGYSVVLIILLLISAESLLHPKWRMVGKLLQ